MLVNPDSDHDGGDGAAAAAGACDGAGDEKDRRKW
eukprot:SAG11_NODE_29260_length_312_cov_4.239437_1_plen_34_part_01